MPLAKPPLSLVLILGALAAFGPMSIDMYLPSFPALGAALHAGPGHVAYTLSAFFVGLSAGQLAYGPLADRFGRRPPLLGGLVLYVLASLGCAFAPNLATLVVMRALQAFGACAGMVMSRAVVRDRFEPTAAARIFSMLMLVMGLAPILAPFLGGFVLQLSGWRAIFVCLAVFGLACLAAVLRGLPESLPAGERQALRLGEIARVYGGQLLDPRFVFATLAGSATQAGMFAYIAGSPFVFITLNGVPESRYGFLFGLNALGLVAASQLNVVALRTAGPRAVLGRALAFAASAATALGFVAATGLGGFVALLLALFAFVSSLGFIVPNAMALALGSQKHHHGQASALLGTLQFTVATLAGSAVGALQDGTARPMAFTIVACALTGLLAYLLTPKGEAADGPPPTGSGRPAAES